MPRPKTIPIKDLVCELAGLNCSQSEIARVCKVSVSTLQKKYKSEMTKGKEYVKTELKRAQFRSALNGSFVMQIWLGKNILGQTDKIETNEKEELLIVRQLKTFDNDETNNKSAVTKRKTNSVPKKTNSVPIKKKTVPKKRISKTNSKTKTKINSVPKTKNISAVEKIKLQMKNKK